MLSSVASSIVALAAWTQVAFAAHGDGAEGTVMGPVAFLWPSDRPWSAAYDNVGPCGSSSSITNRTMFPIGSIGSIELTIADEAYNLAIRVAYGNNPTTQADFKSIKSNVSELEPGHQCYSMPSEASTVASGSNATIQLEYWANDSDKDESFFACADITFVEAALFTEQVMCFNVTASEFELPTSTSPSTAATASSTSAVEATAPAAESTATAETSNGGSGLSGGAKAGIAVGSIVGAALIFAAAFFALRRKRAAAKPARDTEAIAKPMEKVASIGSDRTAH